MPAPETVSKPAPAPAAPAPEPVSVPVDASAKPKQEPMAAPEPPSIDLTPEADAEDEAKRKRDHEAVSAGVIL